MDDIRFVSEMTAACTEINAINRTNGWEVVQPSEWESNKYKIPAILALIHSEASEALEAYRKDDLANFREEMADIVIRVMDCCGGLGINLGTEIVDKMFKNKQRAYRHGGKKI